MTSKFMQALAKLKPSSVSKARLELSKSREAPRGAMAFQADVYLPKPDAKVANAPEAPDLEK